MYFTLTSPPPKKKLIFQCSIYVYFTSKKYRRFGYKNANYYILLHIRQSRKFHEMIIGRDFLQSLKVVIDFEYQVIRWEDVSIPMNRTKLAKNKKEELHMLFLS